MDEPLDDRANYAERICTQRRRPAHKRMQPDELPGSAVVGWLRCGQSAVWIYNARALLCRGGLVFHARSIARIRVGGQAVGLGIGQRDARYRVRSENREIRRKYARVGWFSSGRKFGLQKVVALFATLRKGLKWFRNTFVYKAKVRPIFGPKIALFCVKLGSHDSDLPVTVQVFRYL